MRPRFFIALGVGLLVVSLSLWLWRGESMKDAVETRSRDSATGEKASGPSSLSPLTSAIGVIPQPRLFKSTRYPPETPEEKAMWEWWRAMKKADPNFEWKMPIEFYGRVVDQFGEPVAYATVDITWTALEDSRETQLQSDTNGAFQFVGEKGKRMTVHVNREGYLPTRQSRGSFEYAAFHEPQFHVPDQAAPVVFRLQKIMGAEPMLKFIRNAQIDLASAPPCLDVEKGILGESGDLRFVIKAERTQPGARGPDFSVEIIGVNGAQFVLSADEFMFNAPTEGYQSSIHYVQRASNEAYSPVQPYQFYVKTRTGKYAAVKGEITIYTGLSEGRFGFHTIIYHNPSGSRNLEFDHRRWLNP